MIAEAPYDVSELYDYTVQGHLTHYSPEICVTEENGKEVIYVSYESCMAIEMGTEYDNVTYLKRSTDGGATWTLLGSVADMRWGTIFELDGVIYVIGTARSSSKAMMIRYTPAHDRFESKRMEISLGSGAPCSVVIANGRVWRATSNVSSAPADSDLFDESVWISTEKASTVLTLQDFIRITGTSVADKITDWSLTEGNIVVSPEGKIYAMFRINAKPQCGYTAILEVSQNGTSLKQLPNNNSVVSFPTTGSKYTIKYDEKTQCYIAITSLPSNNNQTTWWACNVRNVAALVVSKDLINWTVVDTLLVDRAVVNETVSRVSHAYQYVDFDFSGDDLRIIVREATGESYHFHDGKYITMYTVSDYAKLIEKHI